MGCCQGSIKICSLSVKGCFKAALRVLGLHYGHCAFKLVCCSLLFQEGLDGFGVEVWGSGLGSR